MIDAAKSGALCIEKLEAMTAVCSVGLDMICIPGDTPADTILAIIADEAAIGMVNNKTTAISYPAVLRGVAQRKEQIRADFLVADLLCRSKRSHLPSSSIVADRSLHHSILSKTKFSRRQSNSAAVFRKGKSNMKHCMFGDFTFKNTL